MKTSRLARPALIAVVLLIATGAVGAVQSGKPAIAKGMSTATIRELIGEPVEIRKFESDGTVGEAWIYRRSMGVEVTQEAVILEQVPAFVGLGYGNSDNIDMIDVPAHRIKRTKRTQVTALLMIGDTLAVARQWVERETVYDN